MLKTEQNTPEMEARVLAAAQCLLRLDSSHEINVHFDHGHWWATCNCGAQWSIVDATGGNSVDGFDVEEVSAGDEDYHRDEEEPEPEEPQAYQRYDLYTEEDGTIRGCTETNDDNDDGYPDGSTSGWNVTYKNREAMLKSLSGGSHVGCSGIVVTVFLDGEEIKRHG